MKAICLKQVNINALMAKGKEEERQLPPSFTGKDAMQLFVEDIAFIFDVYYDIPCTIQCFSPC